MSDVRTEIWKAIENNDVLMLALALHKCQNVDILGDDGITPLMSATRLEHIEAMTYLLDMGANIEAQDQNGTTPLLWAIHENKPNALKLLISRHANLNYIDHMSRTAFMWAARNGNKQMVDMLIDAGADILICIEIPWLIDAAQLARNSGHKELAEYIETKRRQHSKA